MTAERATKTPSPVSTPTNGEAAPILITPVRPPRRRGKWRNRAIAFAILGAATAFGWYYRAPLIAYVRSQTAGSTAAAVQVFTVHRGTLTVSITETGKLRAMKNHSIMLAAGGKITWLAPAGERVKKGALLVTMDPKPFEDSRRTVAGDLETAKQTLIIAAQAIPMAKSKAGSELSAATTKRDEAILALKLYTTLEVPKKLNEFESQTNEIRGKLQEAQKKRIEYQALLDEHLEDDDQKQELQRQLTLSKQTVDSFKNALRTTEDQRKLFRAYSYPQELKSKKQAAANADLEVTKVDVAGKSDLIQKEAEQRKAKELIERLEREIGRLDERIKNCSVYAPADGLIFYGSPDMERYGYSFDQIRVGADWYSNLPIMTIPDLSAFKIDLSIPEVYRGRVAIAQPASVVMEAVPGLTLKGQILTLGTVARGRIPWDSTSPQIFDASISVTDTDPRMVAGMSARVEITTATYDNVLFVPVEAVFNDEGKPVVYRVRSGREPEKIPVRTGAANDHFVLLAAGVSDGDQLLLSRPENFYVHPEFLAQAAAIAATTLPGPTGGGPATTSASTGPATTAASTTSAPASAPTVEISGDSDDLGR